jgi:hypothetical protein
LRWLKCDIGNQGKYGFEIEILMSGMPQAVKNVFDAIRKEVEWVHIKWVNHRQLFGTSNKRIALLTVCASSFFFIVHHVLIDDVIMSLSKLTDPAGKGEKQRLSFHLLQKRMEKHGDHKLAYELNEILGKLIEKSKVIRSHRDKRLAHLDLDIQMKEPNLDNLSVDMIEEILQLTAKYVNAINGHYYKSEVGYEYGMDSNSDAEVLVAKLKRALRFEELIKNEVIQVDDLLEGIWEDA